MFAATPVKGLSSATHATFAGVRCLTRHKRIHTGEKPHVCDKCDKTFAQLGDLTKHKRIHTGERPYKCDKCDKTFAQLGNLMKHKRVHTGEKPYKCNECDKAFAQSCNLTTHKRVHTGEKPYKCDQCDTAFPQSGGLAAHKRIHTGEKPYKCDQCSAAFAQLGNLTKHRRTHAAEMPNKCTLCERRFRTALGLAGHKQVHTRERPYQCQLCGKKFAEASNLKAHERSHAGEKLYRLEHYGASFPQSSCLKIHQRKGRRTETLGVVPDIRQPGRRMPYARKEQLSTRRNGAKDKTDTYQHRNGAKMHEFEAEALHEPSTPVPGHHFGEVKKEQESDDDSLYTASPGSPKEEVKCEPHEEYPLCLTPATRPQNVPAMPPLHQTNYYWPQQPNASFVPSQLLATHGVAEMTGTNSIIARPCTALLAGHRPYNADAMQSADASTPSFSHNAESACVAPFHSYPPWSEQQQTWPHPPPAFSPYVGHHKALADFSSSTEPENHAYRAPAASLLITTPQAPLPVSPAPRLTTPRDLVTPFTRALDYDAAGYGSITFGNTATGDTSQATHGAGYLCPECPYMAQSNDLLCLHHNACHRTSDLTEL